MQVKSCSSFVTISSPGGPYSFNIPSTPAGSNTDVVSGSTYASTSDSSNCALTYALLLSSGTAYSGSFLTIDGTGKVQVDTNLLDSQTVKIRVTAGISNDFS